MKCFACNIPIADAYKGESRTVCLSCANSLVVDDEMAKDYAMHLVKDVVRKSQKAIKLAGDRVEEALEGVKDLTSGERTIALLISLVATMRGGPIPPSMLFHMFNAIRQMDISGPDLPPKGVQ